MRAATSDCLGHGYIDAVHPIAGGAAIHGWAVSFEGGALRGLELEFASIGSKVRSARVGLESPDVAEAVDRTPGSAAARFVAELEVTGRVTDETSALWVVRPLFERGRGHCLVAVCGMEEPPDELLARVGGGGSVGSEFVGHFIDFGGLNRDACVLDVGCGVGRMAQPLLHWLDARGTYDGFDVDRAAIEWCERKIAPRRAGFRFRWIDLRNDLYNEGGGEDAASFRFPYADASFDLVSASSVFTHLLPAEARRYLAESRRVLRRDGRCLFTFFAWSDETRALADSGRSSMKFAHDFGDHLAVDAKVRSDAVAFRESDLDAWIADAGLAIRRKLPGRWPGRSRWTTFQDLWVLELP